MLTTVVTSGVPKKTADILSSATLIILLKNDVAAMNALKPAHGAAYLQTQRPIEMGSAIAKLACNYALQIVKEAMGLAVGPS